MYLCVSGVGLCVGLGLCVWCGVYLRVGGADLVHWVYCVCICVWVCMFRCGRVWMGVDVSMKWQMGLGETQKDFRQWEWKKTSQISKLM